MAKQCCGVARAQDNHSVLTNRAFIRLEVHRLGTGISWYGLAAAVNRLTAPEQHLPRRKKMFF